MADPKAFFENEFYGMDRRLDYDKLPTGMSPLAVNVDLDRIGTVRKRRGTELLGGAVNVDFKVQSIIEYKNNGSLGIQMIRNGTLYNYNDGSWDVLNANRFGITELVAAVNYNGKVYYTSNDDYLCSTSGTLDVIDVGGDNDRIKGKCLGVGQRTLFIGNVTANEIYYPRRVYFSLYNLDTNEAQDQFWNDDEETLLASKRFFEVEGGEVQAIVSFYARNLVYIFSDTKCYTFDVGKVASNPGAALIEVFDIGCCGARAACVVDGIMYWMDKQAKIWAWSGNTLRPTELSYSIDDEHIGESVISQIDKSSANMAKVAAFGQGKKVYFSIGTITLDGKVLNNAAIKITTSQNGLAGYFSIDTYQDRLYMGEPVTLNDSTTLLAGTSNNIVVMNSGLNDVDEMGNDQPIDGYYRTKSFDFDSPFNLKYTNRLLTRFRPQPTEDSYLTVKVGLNNNTDFIDLSNQENNETKNGAINMYDSKYLTTRHKATYVRFSQEHKFYTIAFEFGNKQLNETFEISCFGFDDLKFKSNDLESI